MGYIQIAKLVGLLSFIGLVLWRAYSAGISVERSLWEHKQLLASQELERVNADYRRITFANSKLALEIEGIKHENDIEINHMRDKLDESKRLYGTAKLCKNRVPENRDPGILVTPPDDGAGISAEFQRFLDAELFRADQLRTYVNSAKTWAVEACKLNGIICGSVK